MSLMFFMLVVGVLTVLSWRSICNPQCHGFYRYFCFVTIMVQLHLNVDFWFANKFSVLQLFSWGSLFVSIALVLSSFWLLVNRGGRDQRRDQPENLAFENTTNLLQNGIYAYIRHPMYASLMFLSAGVMLKNPDAIGVFLAVLAMVLIGLAARVEEKENYAYFGESYLRYCNKTARFIPFVY